MVAPTPSDDRGPVVHVQDATVRRGRGAHAFRMTVPQLTIQPGERVACIGPSGCGKTTLLHLLTGIVPPDGGTARLVGEDLAQADDARRRRIRLARVGMVFQELALLPYVSALENILLPVRLGATGERVVRRATRARAKGLAEATGIGHLVRRRPHRLSQGERQRVAICRALIARPALVTADEPTGNLDPARARAVIDLLCERCAEIGAALILVTHDHGLLGRFERVIELGGLIGRTDETSEGGASDAPASAASRASAASQGPAPGRAS